MIRNVKPCTHDTENSPDSADMLAKKNLRPLYIHGWQKQVLVQHGTEKCRARVLANVGGISSFQDLRVFVLAHHPAPSLPFSCALSTARFMSHIHTLTCKHIHTHKRARARAYTHTHTHPHPHPLTHSPTYTRTQTNAHTHNTHAHRTLTHNHPPTCTRTHTHVTCIALGACNINISLMIHTVLYRPHFILNRLFNIGRSL